MLTILEVVFAISGIAFFSGAIYGDLNFGSRQTAYKVLGFLLLTIIAILAIILIEIIKK